MKRSTALLLLLGGIGALALGLNTASHLGETTTSVSAGAPADYATWLTVLGTIAVIAGGLGLFTRRRN
jgi:LPXTG-motif cell wall-anchored protein